ncbi:MAG TPA: hypothetical protein PLP42_01260 [Acidobacteriota bacterium]|nr:hypothetical protein [Acidobacteriota bacterium]
MLIKRILLASLLLLAPAACSRSEEPQEEKPQVAMAEPPQQQPEQQPPAAQTPEPDYQAAEPAPVEKPAAPVQRPRTRQRTARPAPQPVDEPYTPPAVEQPSTDRDVARDSEPIVPPSPSRRMDGGVATPMESGRSAVNTPAPPPRPVTAVLPEGTVIDVRLDDYLSSATNRVGDTFDAILDRDLIVNGQMLAPKGSKVTGKISDVAGAGKVKGLARMALVLTAINVGEERYLIDTNTIRVEAENTKARDAKTVGAGAAIGAAIGAIAGGGKGAAIGAAIGGGAGTAGVLATKGKEVEFQPEHKMSFRLEKDVEMKIR